MKQFSVNYFSIAYSLFPIAIIGCYGYRRLNAFYKLFLLQAFVAMVFYAFITIDFHDFNQDIFNIYIMLESFLIMGAAATVMSKLRERLWILVGFIFFATAYIANMMMSGTSQLFTLALAIEAVPILIIYVVVIYRTSQNSSTRPMIWLCMGLVLYFCGIVPAVGFITPQFSWLSNLFQLRIIEPLGHLRYFLAALSVWLYLRAIRKSNSPAVHG